MAMWKRFFALTILLAMFGVLFGVAYINTNTQKTASKTSQQIKVANDPAAKVEAQKKVGPHSGSDWIDSNIFVAVFTFVLTLIAGFQLFYFRKRERAWVLPKAMTFNVEVHGGQRKFVFKLEWENSGNTPAINVLRHISWRAVVGDLPENFDFSDVGQKEHQPGYMGPNSPTWSEMMYVDASTLSAVANRKLRLFFWGWTTYQDIFPSRWWRRFTLHRTSFCWELDQVIGNPLATTGEVVCNFRIDHRFGGLT